MKRIFTLLFSCVLTSVISAATFTSIGSGNYTVSGTWSQSGVDADGVPDLDDDVVIDASHTVTLVVNSHCRHMTINPTGSLNLNNRVMLNYGNLVQNGTVFNAGSWQFRAPGTYSGNPLNYQGSVYFYSSYTIAAGTTLTKTNGSIIIAASVTVTNNGSVTLNSSSNGFIQFTNSSSRWINAAGSFLSVSVNFVGSGILTASAVPNTVIYKSNSTISILAVSYYDLYVIGTTSHTKTLLGSISVANDFFIQAPVTVNFNNFSMFLGGDWINNANTTCTNMNQVIMVGSSPQTISRGTGNTEIFNQLIVAGGSTVTLADSIRTNSDLTISSGTLDVSASNYNIHCRGTFMDNSVFNARQGTVFMDGSAAQTIDGVATTSFYNLTISNSAGVSVNFTKQVTNILNVAAGAFGPSAFGSLVLVASGTTTCARIAPLGATGSLTGSSWSMQTWIDGPATAYWQYLTSPMTASTVQDWDGDTRFYMSGVGGNDGTACCPTFYSVRTYNTTPNTYSNVTTTGASLIPGRGYMVWMADNLNSLTAPLVFDTRGTPNSGTVNRAVVAGGAGAGYNLVGNPMPCPVTYASVVAASSATLSANFVILQENGSYATNPNGGTIAAAQGFMCIATVAGNITFNESCKSTTATPNVVRMLAGNEIRIKAGNEVNGLGEETTVKLAPGAGEDLNLATDLPYLVSPYDNATHLWTQNANGEQFLLDCRGTESDHLMIPLNVLTSTPGVQTLTFKDLNTVTEYNCAWLEDLTTGARVNLNQYDTYQFTEADMGTTRNFIIHFERTNDCNFNLQNATASLDAQTNVYVSGSQILAQFEFETEEVVTVSMFDLSGRMVMGETTMNVATQTVALESPDAHGIYIVRIQKGNEFSTKKIYY